MAASTSPRLCQPCVGALRRGEAEAVSYTTRWDAAQTRAAKLGVMRAWCAQAGGWLSGDMAELPGDLPDCLALNEMLRHCRNLGVKVCRQPEARP
jgi:hypothetical protein